MLLYCPKNGASYLMKNGPVQWLNIWQCFPLTHTDQLTEVTPVHVYNYSSRMLAHQCNNVDTNMFFIFRSPIDLSCGCIELFGDGSTAFVTANKTAVLMTNGPVTVLEHLFQLWLGTSIDKSTIHKEVKYLLSSQEPFSTWLDKIYRQEFDEYKKPNDQKSIKALLGQHINGDCRELFNIMKKVASEDSIDDKYWEKRSMFPFHKIEWITRLLKDTSNNFALVQKIPEWLVKPSTDKTEESSDVHAFQVISQIRDKSLSMEDRWRAHIAFNTLFGSPTATIPNHQRHCLKNLAKGCSVSALMNVIAKWLNGDGDISSKQLELYLTEIHKIVSQDSYKELVICALFSPWLIRPLLRSCLPQYDTVWKERLQVNNNAFKYGIIPSHYSSDIPSEMLNNWALMSEILAETSVQCDKSGVQFHKWLSIFHQCYIVQLKRLADSTHVDEDGSLSDEFCKLVSEKERDFNDTKDAGPTTALIADLVLEETHITSLAPPTLKKYKSDYNLACFIQYSAFSWMWISYAYRKKIPIWMNTGKLAYMDYKKKTERQKYQTLFLEQIYELSEHSLAFYNHELLDKVCAKNPQVPRATLKSTLNTLVDDERTALGWLPKNIQTCLGIRSMANETLCTKDSYLINKTIAKGVTRALDEGKINTDFEQKDMDKIVSSMPFTPDATQQSFVKRILSHRMAVLKGPPGCGKTATLHLFNLVAKSLGWSVVYLGPTGRSVTRMTQLIPGVKPFGQSLLNGGAKSAYTCMTLDRMVFPMLKSPFATLNPDVIVIDETSMVNSITAAKLFYLIKESTKVPKIVLVGDPEQLFPVDAGSFFVECINSGVIEVLSLTKVYRQSAVKLLQTCQNILNYEPSKAFNQIVLHDPNSLADCTAINGRERVKADEYKRLLMQDYRSSCKAIAKDVLARKIICPRTQGRLGVIEMNFIAQSVWHKNGLTFDQSNIQWSFMEQVDANGKKKSVCVVKTAAGKCYTTDKSDIEDVDKYEVDFEWRRGSVKKWVSYTKKPKNGENVQSADWATLAQENLHKLTDLETGEFCYTPGDPVMAQSEIKGTGIMNGDECVLAGWLNNGKSEYAILLDDMRQLLVVVKMSSFWKHFAPSYAITAHKSQGGEYPHVFICMPWVDVIDGESDNNNTPKYPYYRLLSKRLLYTSVTRTKNICSLYGWRHSYRLCMSDKYTEERNDFLAMLLSKM